MRHDKALAAQVGIPKAFRQHARRHGSDVESMIQMDRQLAAPIIDHWRDRAAKAGGQRPYPYQYGLRTRGQPEVACP